MKYRIIVKTEISGKQWFYIQRRFLFLFWGYIRETIGLTLRTKKIECDTLEEARQTVKKYIHDDYKNSKRKIILKEVINDVL